MSFSSRCSLPGRVVSFSFVAVVHRGGGGSSGSYGATILPASFRCFGFGDGCVHHLKRSACLALLPTKVEKKKAKIALALFALFLWVVREVFQNVPRRRQASPSLLLVVVLLPRNYVKRLCSLFLFELSLWASSCIGDTTL